MLPRGRPDPTWRAASLAPRRLNAEADRAVHRRPCAGIRGADVVAAVTGDDEVNLAVTSLARFEFQVPRIIARVNNPRNAWMFTHEMGVDVALNQADLMARLIEEEMSLGDMMTLLKLRKGQYSLVLQSEDEVLAVVHAEHAAQLAALLSNGSS